MTYSITEKTALKVLCYFDVRGVCLRLSELERWAPNTKVELDNLMQNGVVETRDEFYFLKGRSELVVRKVAGEVASARKIVIAQKAARFLQYVPFLRAVLVCNSVAEGTATVDSDIDVLIVSEVKRVWVVRFFANLILKMFRLRTRKDCEKDKICLSYFVDASNINFSDIRIAKDDIHKAFWIQQLLPVYDPGGLAQIIMDSNSWVTPYVAAQKSNNRYLVADSKGARWWRGFWERSWRGAYGNMVENEAKKFQWEILKKRLGDKINAPGFGIVLGSGIIKLHEHDTRVEVRAKWLERMRQFII